MGGGNNTNPHSQGMKWLKRRKKKMKRMNEERMQWKEDKEDEGDEQKKKNGLEINKTDISLGKTKKKKKTKTKNCSRIAVLFSSRSLFSVARLRRVALFVLL